MAKNGFIKDKDLGWKQIQRELKKIDGYQVTSGIQKDSGSNLALIAAVNEFGSTVKGIPSRPAFRSAIDKNQQFFSNFIKATLKKAILKNRNAMNGLRLIGVFMTSEIQKSIRDDGWTPNDPKTIARKGSDHPLIDTGRTIGSVHHKIEKGRKR